MIKKIFRFFGIDLCSVDDFKRERTRLIHLEGDLIEAVRDGEFDKAQDIVRLIERKQKAIYNLALKMEEAFFLGTRITGNQYL